MSVSNGRSHEQGLLRLTSLIVRLSFADKECHPPPIQKLWKESLMAFITISHWTSTDMSDETIAVAQDKFIPMIMSVGATGVQMVRTGESTLCVVTHYSDAAAAEAASAKIAEIRASAASDFPMTMVSVHAGEVIGSA